MPVEELGNGCLEKRFGRGSLRRKIDRNGGLNVFVSGANVLLFDLLELSIFACEIVND